MYRQMFVSSFLFVKNLTTIFVNTWRTETKELIEDWTSRTGKLWGTGYLKCIPIVWIRNNEFLLYHISISLLIKTAWIYKQLLTMKIFIFFVLVSLYHSKYRHLSYGVEVTDGEIDQWECSKNCSFLDF